MGESVRCPNCNTYLEVIDCYDSDLDGFVSTYYYIGQCPNCKKQFSWKEIYIWQGIENLEEEINNG